MFTKLKIDKSVDYRLFPQCCLWPTFILLKNVNIDAPLLTEFTQLDATCYDF